MTQSKTPGNPDSTSGKAGDAPPGEARDASTLARDATVWAAVSHEIRTPLTGVMGMLEILGHTSLTEEQRRIIATAEASSLTLMRIVDDVLDFAKLESTSVTLAPVPTDIGALAEDCAAILSGQAGAKGLIVTCETDSRLPRVVCDPVRVRQLLVNLGGNAVKFTDQGGVAITAQMTAATPAAAPATVGVRLSVRDSGIGIPEELRPFLFQPFSRLATGGTSRSGAGLGLAICRRIVEIMGGGISVEAGAGPGSQKAGGSVFHVDLILPVAAQARDAGPALKGVQVLAVEGDRATAIALRYLQDAGATVTRLRGLGEVTHHLGSHAPGADSLEPQGPSLVLLSPDAESEDIAAVCHALEAMAQGAPPVLWLRPRPAGAAPAVRGVESAGAYPIRRADLLAAVKRAIDPPDASAVAAAVVTRRAGTAAGFTAVREESMAYARAEGRVVLVAEDNPINQDVLRQQLSILGFDCDIAENGAAALKALATGRYLVMLCDCHMPGVDGFELTRRVRATENGAARLPIIAITANALPGEAARCLAAGMDDYLAKPIEIRTLNAMLDRWVAPDYRSAVAIPPPDAPLPVRTPPPSSAPARVVDIRNLEAIYGNDPERLALVLTDWRSGIENAVRTITGALAKGQPDAALDAAHRIKGSAGIAGAYGLSVEAGALEAALRAGNRAAVQLAARRVETLADAAISEVAQTMGGGRRPF